MSGQMPESNAGTAALVHCMLASYRSYASGSQGGGARSEVLRQSLANSQGTECACPLKNVMQPLLIPIVPSLSLPCSES